MMRSSNSNPYGSKPTLKENIIGAIELAELCKEFADNGQHEEAMNIGSDKWIEVIEKLKGKLDDCA